MASKYPHLLSTFKLGTMTLPNRLVMAPMSRVRAEWSEDLATDLMREYYAQRAGAGLIITESINISKQGKGYVGTPSIYSEKQVQSWKKVTDAVHAKGGRIVAQLAHVGRVSHTSVTGLQPVAPSALKAENTIVFVAKDAANSVFAVAPVDMPRAMTLAEIRTTVADFAKAAQNAVKAGFDAVEIHGGHGYLIDQFLRAKSNQRTDEYGGSVKNRLRFALEVTKAVIDAVGAKRVGVRISPYVQLKDMVDASAPADALELVSELDKLGLLYVHHLDDDRVVAEKGLEVGGYYKELRKRFKGPLIAASYKTPADAEHFVKGGLADLVAFGRAFMANPDLVERLAHDVPLASDFGRDFYYGGGAHGYTDFPSAATDKKAK